MNFEVFLQFHKPQLEAAKIPPVFWQSIFSKVTNETFNTGNYFSIEKVEYEDSEEDEEATEELIQNGNLPSTLDWERNEKFYNKCEYRVVVECDRMEPDDRENVFLVDHMWTFELNKRKELLHQNGHLLERLCALMDIKRPETLSIEQKVQLVDFGLFKFCMSYCLSDGQRGNTRTYWYILDEFGSRIGHSVHPNFRCVPFTYLQGGITYNLLFPVKAVSRGDVVTINYIELDAAAVTDPHLAMALMLPWEPSNDLSSLSFAQTESESAFAFKHKPEQILPEQSHHHQVSFPSTERLKVFSQYRYVNENLTDERFQLLDDQDQDQADILWLYEPFYGYKELARDRPNTLVNQFPFETVLTLKDLFAIVCRRAATDESRQLDEYTPLWLTPTFDLQRELVQFVSYFQNRRAQNLDNHWIVKPWNLSRGLETVITSNLALIVKLRNALPKVVCKYIERPVLFPREDIDADVQFVKFDLRFIVLLKSVAPLQVYVYKNFWIRFANVGFSLDELDNYEKHFTVMNYAADKENVPLRQMFCSEFIGQFDSQYGKNRWSQFEQATFAVIKQVFECATMKEPPAGIGKCAQSRGMYGIDILPRWRTDADSGEELMQPTVLEVNWMPDCKRATEYYPSFFNEVFSTLFTEKVSENMHLL